MVAFYDYIPIVLRLIVPLHLTGIFCSSKCTVGRSERLPRDRASQATLSPPLSPTKAKGPPQPSMLSRTVV